MPEITRSTISYRRQKNRRKRVRHFMLRLFSIIGLILAITLTYGYYRYASAVTPISAEIRINDYNPPLPQPLAWPNYGQSAVGSVEFGVLSTNGEQTPVPTASTAKLITVLAILESRPLKLGQSGPTITIKESDAQLYHQYVAVQGSVVPVNIGEKISLYQALQAILLASSNNLADSLAIWAFGSLENYSLYANQMLKSYGLQNTTVGSDASGLSPTTTSTASDLLRIAQKALQNPIIKQIVGQEKANIPVAGVINNHNRLLGSDGINGVKTGFSDEAGATLILSGKFRIPGGNSTTLLSVVMGGEGLTKIFDSSKKLYDSIKPNLAFVQIVASGSTVGRYQSAWGKSVLAVATKTINGPIWLPDTANLPDFKFNKVKAPAHVGDNVGSITFKRADGVVLESEIRLSEDLPAPNLKWRLLSQ